MLTLRQVTRHYILPLNFSIRTAFYLNKLREKQDGAQSLSFDSKGTALQESNLDMSFLVPHFFTNSLKFCSFPNKKVSSLAENHFTNSYIQIHLPLQFNTELSERMKKLNEQEIRIGRLFELMDSLAGLVSYRHCFASLTHANPMSCVTGSVQSFHLFGKMSPIRDLTLQGYLNYTGKTSMEVEINLRQDNALKSCAIFTMIARNSHDLTKGYPVPQLSLAELSESSRAVAEKRMKIAQQNVIKRKVQMENSYDRKPPSVAEVAEIHDIFLRRKNSPHRQSIGISTTVLTNNQLMHTQKRNVHGKIFGGYLIREMIEIGWLSGSRFAEEQLAIEHLTNIYFKKPVEVGLSLILKAQVTYVRDNLVIVTVEAYKSSFMSDPEMACYLHLFLRAKNDKKEVHPQSYEEALQYLSSRKSFIELFGGG